MRAFFFFVMNKFQARNMVNKTQEDAYRVGTTDTHHRVDFKLEDASSVCMLACVRPCARECVRACVRAFLRPLLSTTMVLTARS